MYRDIYINRFIKNKKKKNSRKSKSIGNELELQCPIVEGLCLFLDRCIYLKLRNI